MPSQIAMDGRFGRRRPVRAARPLLLVAGLLTVPAAEAQSSPVCEFAVATIAATQLDLGSARRRYRECAKSGGASCKVELARVRDLQHRLKLARSYLDRYCMR